MSGIIVADDAVNMYYYLKAKSTVSPAHSCCILYMASLAAVWG